jgi:hypothetical protein
MVSRFGSYHTTRSHLSFLPGRRVGVVVVSTGGLSALTDIVAAYAYDLEAGRPDAHGRAEARMAELRDRFANARRNVATQDSIRAARQRQPLGRPLTDFAGRYREPSFGEITFAVHDGRLAYRWGAVHGPVEIFDAAKGQLRIEIAGSGEVATFSLSGGGPARSVEVRRVVFPRVP